MEPLDEVTTTEVFKPTNFSQIFPCQNKVRLRAGPVLQQNSALGRCKMHPKQIHIVVQMMENGLDLN